MNSSAIAQGGQSPYNTGRAIDVAPVTGGTNEVDWSEPITPEIAEYGKRQGFQWGGDWNTFKDYPHFEMEYNK